MLKSHEKYETTGVNAFMVPLALPDFRWQIILDIRIEGSLVTDDVKQLIIRLDHMAVGQRKILAPLKPNIDVLLTIRARLREFRYRQRQQRDPAASLAVLGALVLFRVCAAALIQ